VPEAPRDLPEVEVEAAGVAAWIAEGQRPLFIDIREPHELWTGTVAGALSVPMNHIPANLAGLPADRPLVIYCAAGMRSFGVAHWLREQGREQAWSLVGGIGAWLETGAARAQPPPDASLRLLTPVGLAPEAAAQRGLSPDNVGTIQEIHLQEDGVLRYRLALPEPSGVLGFVDGLTEADLRPVGRGR